VEPWIKQVVLTATVLVSVVIGFVMGFKAARPENKLIERERDPGSTEEPEGDLWQDAMTPPVDKDERVRTL